MFLEIWQFIIIVIVLIVLVAIATFFITRKIFERTLEKNPPINEDMIKIMMSSMGRTPSQKQVNLVMKQMQKMNK